MQARNHELTGFAAGALYGHAAGCPPLGSLLLGLLGAWSADWPDLDHHGSTATKSLRWIPYWIDWPRDHKTGDYRTTKKGRVVRKVRWFPSRQVHQGLCALSAAIWDRCATPADRRDTAGSWGPAFRVHRGFTHSVWFAALVGLAVYLISGPVVGAVSGWRPVDWWLPVLGQTFGAVPVPVLLGCTVAVGCVTHVLGDGCTDFGISPFAPLLKVGGRRYPRLAVLPEPMRFKVSKWVEDVIVSKICWGLAGLAAIAVLLGPWRVVGGLGEAVAGLWQALA